MAHIRKTASGKWQAIVTLPDGRQRSKTDALKGVVKEWAKGMETDAKRGDLHDDRAARATTLAEWHKQWRQTRIVSENTSRKNSTHWRVHIEPKWGGYGLAAITRAGVKQWVADMVREGVGNSTIEATVTLLGKMLADAVDVGLLRVNVAARIPRPRPELKTPFFWRMDEAEAIAAHCPEPYGTFVTFAFHTGLRMGEMRGMRVEQLDFDRGQVHVTRVETRQGPVDITKGGDRRTVPFPPALIPELRKLTQGREALAYVWAEDGKRVIDDRNFHRRVFEPARVAAGAPEGTPHDMRHTAASWLVMAGVDLYRVQALLGHADAKTTMRYSHLAPDAFDRVTAAWSTMRQVSAEVPRQLPASSSEESCV